MSLTLLGFAPLLLADFVGDVVGLIVILIVMAIAGSASGAKPKNPNDAPPNLRIRPAPKQWEKVEDDPAPGRDGVPEAGGLAAAMELSAAQDRSTREAPSRLDTPAPSSRKPRQRETSHTLMADMHVTTDEPQTRGGRKAHQAKNAIEAKDAIEPIGEKTKVKPVFALGDIAPNAALQAVVWSEVLGAPLSLREPTRPWE